MKKFYIIVFLSFLFSHSVFSQNKISGVVVDAENEAPLVFATVIFNNNKNAGTITDIDGHFSFSSEEKINSLTVSYMGYETEAFNLQNQKTIQIKLSPSNNQLEEVVLSTENPAYPIIRKAIENRESNNPENINSFTYTSYNKTVFDYKFKNKAMADTSKIKEFLKGGHFFIMESVTERKFLAPNLSEEKVIGNKVSGFKNPYFAALATDIQPFSFYDENINLLDLNFLNPISDGSLNKYQYILEETLYQNTDTIHIISFEPKPNKNFSGLKGRLYINTKNYAIQNVLASPAEKGKINLNIQQKYIFVNNKQWFPEQLNFEMIFTESPSKDVNVFASGKSYISEVNLNPTLERKDFPIAVVSITEDAPKKDSLFWEKHRIENLKNTEVQTYKVIDSIGEEANLDGMLSLFEKLPEGKIPMGYVDLDLKNTFNYNKYEGLRLGLGLYTNEKVFKNLSIGAFAGYGFKDYEWKYGGEIIQQISRKHDWEMSFGYQNNLKEVGTYGLPLTTSFGNYFTNQRDYLAFQMDHIQMYQFKTSFRAFRYAKWNINLSQAKITPLYEYIFEKDGNFYNNYHNSEINIGLRYAYGEKIIDSYKNKISLGTKYPVLSLNYSRGIKDVLQSDFNYNKIEGRIEQSFFTKNFGTSNYRLQAGLVDTALPMGLLFTGEGSRDDDFPLLIPHTFQTMQPYEFVSDRYVHLFTTHNFGSLLFKSENFKPGFVLHNNIGWGDLSNPENHYFTNFKTQKHTYFETGLEVNNLLRINYLNMGYLGLGAGAFYRYGAYSLDDFGDNFVFKFNFTMSFF